MVFAAREPSDLYAGLPELVVEAVGDADARALLASVIPGRLDERVADQLVAETSGNPLALLELPRGLSPAQLAGGFGLPGALSLQGRLEASFLKRLAALPEDTQRLVLMAAAEPVGDPALLSRAASGSGSPARCSSQPSRLALIEVGARVRFRHPLVRSAVYRAASPQSAGRCTAHWPRRPTRRSTPTGAPGIWPRLRPAPTRTSQSSSSGRPVAPRRGAVSPPPLRFSSARPRSHPNPRPEPSGPWQRRRRSTRRARSTTRLLWWPPPRPAPSTTSGAPGSTCCGRRSRSPPGGGSDAPPLLLRAARELEADDPDQARATYLEAFSAAMFAGRLTRGGREVGAERGRARRPPAAATPASARSPPSGVGGPVYRGVCGGRADPEGGAPRFRAGDRPAASGGTVALVCELGRFGAL